MSFLDKLTGKHDPNALSPSKQTAKAAPREVMIPLESVGEEHTGGRINLSKGGAIRLAKTPVLTASCTWPPSTDYDVFALVLYRDGHVEAVSTFGTLQNPSATPATHDRAVVHRGDVGRSNEAVASESIDIQLNDNIVMVVPVVYSAQSNGTGSFHRYKVSMSVDNGAGQQVVVNANDALDDDMVYSCIPGVVVNTPRGAEVRSVELYSARGSEQRPVVHPDGRIVMDVGPENIYK